MKVPDFCKDMYNPELVWYKYWTKYALNAAEVRDQCALPGVKLIYEPFNIDVAFSVSGTLLSGRHKIVITMEAIDPMYKKAAQSICFEMIGAIFEQS
ncbi:CheB42b [Drosophila busckii]|uniref:CheB42b n=2 Tax=Drosophila busckii TaxID=30019 RepID=A0A0M4EAI0_DROBS|nr:CheB42b [Drosophila busckii]